MPNPDPSYVKSGDPVTASNQNNMVAAIRRLDNSTPRQGLRLGGGSPSAPCPFGETAIVDNKQTITGGILFAGDKTYNVTNFEIDVEYEGAKLIYFEVPVIVNMDDDSVLLLPAVRTSTWSVAWKDTTTDTYPDSTNPVIGTGQGTIIIPIGQLTTSNGALSTFVSTGCGNIRINHCSGTLSYARE